MKILYILKTELEDSTKKIIEEHKKDNDVKVIDLRSNKDYNMIVELTEKADKVIVW